MQLNSKQALEQGFTAEEFNVVSAQLGHDPTLQELVVYSILLGSDRAFDQQQANGVVEFIYTGSNRSSQLPFSIFEGTKNSTPVSVSVNNESKTDIETLSYPEDLLQVALTLLKNEHVAAHLRKSTNVTHVETRVIHQEIDAWKAIALTIAEVIAHVVCQGITSKHIKISLKTGSLNTTSERETLASYFDFIHKLCHYFQLSIVQLTLEIQSTSTTAYPSLSASLVSGEPIHVSGAFQYKGDLIFILGESVEDVGGSYYLNLVHNQMRSSAPHLNIEKLRSLFNAMEHLIRYKVVNAATYCSIGGIFTALTKMALPNELGFDIVTDAEIREDAFLFGEAGGRIIVTVNEDYEDDFIEFMMDSGVNFTLLGHVTQGKMVVDDEHFGFSKEVKKIIQNT
jgi:phosphoribosylformylglycinamidine (FGAM) synthase-like enzyme